MEQFSICLAEEKDVDDIYRLMCVAKAGLVNPDYYEADDREYVARHIVAEGFTLIAKYKDLPVAFLMLRYPGMSEDNLIMDMIGLKEGKYVPLLGINAVNLCADKDAAITDIREKTVHFESAAVLETFRGHGLQKRMIKEALDILKTKEFRFYFATVHPENAASLKSLKEFGFKEIDRLIKYGGMERLLLFRDK